MAATLFEKLKQGWHLLLLFNRWLLSTILMQKDLEKRVIPNQWLVSCSASSCLRTSDHSTVHSCTPITWRPVCYQFMGTLGMWAPNSPWPLPAEQRSNSKLGSSLDAPSLSFYAPCHLWAVWKLLLFPRKREYRQRGYLQNLRRGWDFQTGVLNDVQWDNHCLQEGLCHCWEISFGF